MQSTIFGASCAERARFKQAGQANKNNNSLQRLWEDDEFANAGLDKRNQNVVIAKPTRLFRAWIEDWDETA